MELRKNDPGKTMLMTILVTAGVAAAVLLVVVVIALASKESCPFVYVQQDGTLTLVGEAYAGAAFRSLKREDMLPLPPVAPGAVTIRLANEAFETQCTDRAVLAYVDHVVNQRVVSSYDARLLLVGDERAPAVIRDFDGSDIARNLRTKDGKLWESDMAEASRESEPALRDGFVAEFAVAEKEGRPVLEMVAGNTPLLDVAFGRFFALFGGTLGKYIDKGNDAESGPRLREWRAREGVDLRVEVLKEGTWQKVALIPTVGPVALRRIAVPLPLGAYEKRIKVKVTGGLGFWRFDEICLSSLIDGDPVVKELAVSRAHGKNGKEYAPLFIATDDEYHVMDVRGDYAELTYETPELAEGLERSAFFFSSGYYNVHRPLQSTKSLGTLKTIRDEPGSLARFGLDLYRRYEQLAFAR